MARKTSSRSGRGPRSSRAELQVPPTTPKGRAAEPQPAPALELRVVASAPSTTLGGESLHEQIARRAYELFLARGGTGGDPFHDWLHAERELLQARAA
jgi:hypothetical protein